MMRHLRRAGYRVGRKRIRRLMGLMGLRAIYQKANTSRPHPRHRVYPYLLRGLQINRSGQVWTADISYIPMQRGFFYLAAVMDWASRKVLSWRLSNTLEADFCLEALEEALDRYGAPDIFKALDHQVFLIRIRAASLRAMTSLAPCRLPEFAFPWTAREAGATM